MTKGLCSCPCYCPRSCSPRHSLTSLRSFLKCGLLGESFPTTLCKRHHPLQPMPLPVLTFSTALITMQHTHSLHVYTIGLFILFIFGPPHLVYLVSNSSTPSSAWHGEGTHRIWDEWMANCSRSRTKGHAQGTRFEAGMMLTNG